MSLSLTEEIKGKYLLITKKSKANIVSYPSSIEECGAMLLEGNLGNRVGLYPAKRLYAEYEPLGIRMFRGKRRFVLLRNHGTKTLVDFKDFNFEGDKVPVVLKNQIIKNIERGWVYVEHSFPGTEYEDKFIRLCSNISTSVKLLPVDFQGDYLDDMEKYIKSAIDVAGLSWNKFLDYTERYIGQDTILH